MKRLLILVLVLVCVVLVGVFFYLRANARHLLEQFKPEIESIASHLLGSPVRLKNMDLAISFSPVIKVGEVVIGSDPQNSLSLKDLLLSVELYPLLSQELQVTKLAIRAPRIVAVRSSEGVEIVGVPKAASSAKPHDSAGQTPSDSGPAAMGFKLALQSIEVRDGEIVLKDTAAQRDYVISSINVDAAVEAGETSAALKNLVVTASALGVIPVTISAPAVTVDPKTRDLSPAEFQVGLLGGKAQINLTGNVRHLKFDLRVAAEGLALDQLGPLATQFPVLKDLVPTGTVGANLLVTVASPEQFTASGSASLRGIGAVSGPYKIAGGNGDVQLTAAKEQQQAAVKGLTLTLNGASVSVDATPVVTKEGVRIADLVLHAFGGTLKGEAGLSFSSTPSISARTVIEGMSIEPALNALQPGGSIPVTGVLKRVQSDIRGTLDANLIQSLAGNASIDVTDATIKQFNFIGALLDSIKAVTLWSGGGAEGMGSPDTKLNSLTGSFSIGGGKLTTKNLAALSNKFTFDGDGRIGFDGTVELNATTAFTPEFTASMIAVAKEIGKIADTKGRLVIPLTLVGKAPDLTPLPNIEKIAELAAKRIAKDQASKTLDSVLGSPGAGKAITDLLDF